MAKIELKPEDCDKQIEVLMSITDMGTRHDVLESYKDLDRRFEKAFMDRLYEKAAKERDQLYKDQKEYFDLSRLKPNDIEETLVYSKKIRELTKEEQDKVNKAVHYLILASFGTSNLISYTVFWLSLYLDYNVYPNSSTAIIGDRFLILWMLMKYKDIEYNSPNGLFESKKTGNGKPLSALLNTPEYDIKHPLVSFKNLIKLWNRLDDKNYTIKDHAEIKRLEEYLPRLRKVSDIFSGKHHSDIHEELNQKIKKIESILTEKKASKPPK